MIDGPVNDIEESLLYKSGTFTNFDIDYVDGLLRLLVIMHADDTVILTNNVTDHKCAIAALQPIVKSGIYISIVQN